MSEIKRKRGESFEAFIRRVKQTWQRSGKILEVRKRQVFTGKPNKNSRKKSALKRQEIKGEMEYLRKTGKLPKKDLNGFNNRGQR